MRTLFVLFIFIAGTAAECCQKRRIEPGLGTFVFTTKLSLPFPAGCHNNCGYLMEGDTREEIYCFDDAPATTEEKDTGILLIIQGPNSDQSHECDITPVDLVELNSGGVNWETIKLPEKIEAQQVHHKRRLYTGVNDHLLIHDIPGSPIDPDEFRASENLGDEFFGKDNHNDPIESAGLFEGDIDNVSMNGLFKIKGLKNALKDGSRKEHFLNN
ncbi:uncharacterized protein LOC111698828 [Eurytemora carolleeae]|uniref:uncharacterized protein LOC111698828 n=1 Tax=Eurytemora carolleeae TaxID=1294199 RepID=UPI000C775FE9|nr:uncharacterized protein LOC111698828 [Eurytemora carolleeae]|eukprot:XP_023325045.1 uncharacterized protein LOC111698828 [Eurytemora affinis]